MNKAVKSTLSLVIICAGMALLIALANMITAPIIKKNEQAKGNAALLQVMPEGEGFEQLNLSTYELPKTVEEAYKETTGKGYVLKLRTAGYGADFVIMCGVKADGTVSGAVCLSSNETLGEEKTYGDKLKDANLDTIDAIDTVAGITKTTLAYKNAVKDALNAKIVLDGGSVDLRTEEEILQDNLKASLPGAISFEKVFIVEVIDESIDAIYKENNGKGFVLIIGEEFIAVNGEGTCISEVEDTVKTLVENTVSIISATTTVDIDLTTYTNLPQELVWAKKTATGNYIVQVKGDGFSIHNEYGKDHEYILVNLSITKEGKVIDCYTYSHKETSGIGDVCTDEKFYSQFDGKTENDLPSLNEIPDLSGDEPAYTKQDAVKDVLDDYVDVIGGATITTRGYVKAVVSAFEVVKVLEGGQN
ncbi:MAG: FMN-binding protein [Clostridiales bacterium]|nr:FMN-binding protein [Clostridiales bacterium]